MKAIKSLLDENAAARFYSKAFSRGKFTIAQIIKTGFIINIFAIIVISFFTITLGIIFNIDLAIFPDWAQKVMNSSL